MRKYPIYDTKPSDGQASIVEYLIIAITPRSTLIQKGRTC